MAAREVLGTNCGFRIFFPACLSIVSRDLVNTEQMPDSVSVMAACIFWKFEGFVLYEKYSWLADLAHQQLFPYKSL